MHRFLVFSFQLLLFSFASAQGIEINSSSECRPVFAVKVKEAPVTNPEKYLQIFLVDNNKVATIPLSGTYQADKNLITFTPFYDLGRGLVFEARYYHLKDTIKKRIQIPLAKSTKLPSTEVLNFYPLSNSIPGNILRFHIEFSNPMMNDEMAFLGVKILNEKNEEVKMMWRHKSYWINEKILVMMIHPGRVKKGITNYSELGPMFEFGKEYTMVVTTQLKDTYDRNLKQEYKRTFKIIEDDREIPKIIANKVKAPKLNSKAPLEIRFSEGMDCVSIIEGITVFEKGTQVKIKGNFSAFNNDSIWHFVPEQEWTHKEYEIIFDKEVSDFASNYLHRLFEITDLKELNEDKMPIRLYFTPKN